MDAAERIARRMSPELRKFLIEHEEEFVGAFRAEAHETSAEVLHAPMGYGFSDAICKHHAAVARVAFAEELLTYIKAL